MASEATEEFVQFRRDGVLGRITLSRPHALNALTFDMVTAMLRRVEDWAGDDAVQCVVIDAVPGRAFCAGGDIRMAHDLGPSGQALEFFRTEYRLNAAIKHFPKPYVALIDGICMGGGAGVSVHGRYRVVSENTLFAMPETSIGLFNDIGASYFLPRCPGRVGFHLGLAGARIRAADMLYCGLATHFVRAQTIGAVAPRLAAGEGVEAVLASLIADPGEAELAPHREAIDRAYAENSVEGILAGLERESDWAAGIAALLRTRSPTSLKLVLRELTEGLKMDFDDCMAMEFRIVGRVLKGHDFYEGVRAVLIDRDNAPAWAPPRLEDVSDDDIARYFEP